MNTLRYPLLVCLVVLSTTLAAFGHVGGHGAASLRTWHTLDGSQRTGSLHSFRGDHVVIEDRFGKLQPIAYRALSIEDAQYAFARFQSIAQLHEPILHKGNTIVPTGRHKYPFPWDGVLLGALGAVLCALLLFVGHSVGYDAASSRLQPNVAFACAVLVVGIWLAASPSAISLMKQQLAGNDPVSVDSTFQAFKPLITTRWDATNFYVESNGMPTEMPAMKGITAWQQQVPIPQPYVGNNAWTFPLTPVVADVPVGLDTALHTGAVAIGVNGIPVFNPENNRGEFSYDIGELDAFGGHCGRADDYHYHIAPLHLQKVVGPTKPIAWALDGYPLYGYTEPDGSMASGLDEHLGHLWQGAYHYHAIATRPYLIASLRGKVTVQNDQVMPQPRASSVRPFLQALRGATITDLRKCDTSHYALRYTLNGKTHWVNYRWDENKNYTYVFVKPDTARRTEMYQRK